ncbi:PrsW family glutamic-type intramembrane protease [Streptomonospora nanhaiensis]|uniref:PrsW family glutamic-type intramembrane protease n=1 Tax=Streptomonospora nanhaiensis TaxID=1323731 RepID=A0ABY6YKH5_9ACTN|nr:PrsW family glutamic-type intramembrane protease [Streptomonospora nanhaiensis]WAE72835.1 PrsW family glutamic-type intramembrane protease [Streptomonospora nanhaiensis]
MEEQAMLARDLVLRVCAGATELDPQWIRVDGKVTTPFLVPRDRNLIRAIVSAGRAMGVDRLLVCRTRPEFSYDPVTEVPLDTDTLIDLIRGWGPTPTDFLVCVEDFSAAVLVTADELTVAAGPADFVRELVGADIPQARVHFGNRARVEGGPVLTRAALLYNCADTGARHARSPRGPGPDLPERLARRGDRLRERSPRAVGALRALRGAWGWLAVVALLVAPLFVPSLDTALPALAAAFVLLFQLAWPARSRTVSFATLLRVAALGALLLWPLALAEAAVVGLLGVDPYGVVGYTYVAVAVEEAGKLAPLLLLGLVARRRMRRLAAVDFLLLAAASGAGFQLAEHLLTGVSTGGGDRPGGGGFLLPGGSTVTDASGAVLAVFSGHAVTTGLVGAALGLAVVGRRYGAWLWLLPPVAFTAAFLEHLNLNAVLANAALHPVSGFVHGLLGGGVLTPWLLVVLLLCAVAMDYRTIGTAAESTPPLPGRPPLAGLRRRARGRSVAMRVRVPADIAPLFRRLALSWVDLPVTLATTLSTIVHEFAVSAIAARRGPGALCDTWRFLRRRRANAMAEARSAGRPWRSHPSQEELTRQARSLARRLGLAATGGVTAATASFAAAAVYAAAAPGASGPGGAADRDAPAYAFVALDRLQLWLGGLTGAETAWAALVLVAALSLLVSGNGVPHAHPRMREFLRAPTANTGAILGMLAPGQIGYALLGLAGLLLPRRVDRLLVR